jgi:hypothetical protein
MLHLDSQQDQLVGPCGNLPLSAHDEVTGKLAMLIAGECLGLGPVQAAKLFGYSKQRYFQLREVFAQQGAAALVNHKPGPGRRYRCTDEVVRQAIRHRFLDPTASAEVIAQKLTQGVLPISTRSVQRIIERFGLQKKLHRCKPSTEAEVPVVASRTHTNTAKADPQSLERGVRQILADKVAGSHLGLWLLVPEHLRLGTWDLLLDWTQQPPQRVEPRLALQLVHEAALCVAGLRAVRSLPQTSFGLLQGLPFLASDQAIHQLLGSHTVEQAQQLQCALGLRRRALGDYVGKVLLIDPHRFRSHSKRRMRKHRKEPTAKASKVVQTFFAFDGDTRQPVCFTIGTPSRTVTQATPELLGLVATILGAPPSRPLVLADAEHTIFDLLVPMILQPSYLDRLRELPAEQFTRRWAGYATLRSHYTATKPKSYTLPLWVQRFGEPPGECKFNAFVCTADRDELQALTDDYPKRWHAEEFFNSEQALGWERAGTQNLHIRYGHMTMALLAQAALRRLRLRLGEMVANWDAKHLAKDVLQGLEGDVRVTTDPIAVTYYNAANSEWLKHRYEGLPGKLRAEGLNPEIPWLYGYQLDFRFR